MHVSEGDLIARRWVMSDGSWYWVQTVQSLMTYQVWGLLIWVMVLAIRLDFAFNPSPSRLNHRHFLNLFVRSIMRTWLSENSYVQTGNLMYLVTETAVIWGNKMQYVHPIRRFKTWCFER